MIPFKLFCEELDARYKTVEIFVGPDSAGKFLIGVSYADNSIGEVRKSLLAASQWHSLPEVVNQVCPLKTVFDAFDRVHQESNFSSIASNLEVSRAVERALTIHGPRKDLEYFARAENKAVDTFYHDAKIGRAHV